MGKKTKMIILVIVAALIVVTVLVVVRIFGRTKAGESEIVLNIQLDLKEDIGLLIIDSDICGRKASGGVSNADKSMIRMDERLAWSIDKQNYENTPEVVELTLRFTVVTEYCDPNYENIYPEEYLIPMDAIVFPARFGEAYSIRITGDKTNGYQAGLE